MNKDDAAEAPDNYSPALGDWRCAKPTWVTALDGVAVPEPVAAHQVTWLNTEWQETSFITPSATALHLNSAWRSAGVAARLKPRIAWNRATVAPGRTSVQSGIEGADVVFDYFEAAMSSAMSSFAAIEAFCNSVIVDRSTQPLKLKRRKVLVEMTPEEVEREVTTDEKLKRIVPNLLNVSTPAGKKVWHDYVALKRLRDSVTHFKRRDQARHAELSHEPTALQDLLNADPYGFPEAAMAAIEYFYKPEELPRWMRNPRWIRATD